MSLRHLSSHAIIVAVSGACVFLLSAYMGSAGVLAQIEAAEALLPLAPDSTNSLELQTVRDTISGAESRNIEQSARAWNIPTGNPGDQARQHAVSNRRF